MDCLSKHKRKKKAASLAFLNIPSPRGNSLFWSALLYAPETYKKDGSRNIISLILDVLDDDDDDDGSDDNDDDDVDVAVGQRVS